MLEIVTTDSFPTAVAAAPGPVLVDFWGPQCKPCLALMPAVERLAERFAGQVRVVKVNAHENRRLCINLRVMGLPAFLLFRDGKEIKRLAGDAVTSRDLERLLAEAVGESAATVGPV